MMNEDQTLNAPWARYEPSPEAPWDLRRVVHLHRRAGFAASWSEIQRDLAEGPEASIARLLSGKARAPGAPEPEEFERISTVLGDAAIASSDAGRLKAWWIYRMLFSPDPLGERLTLMWHNHFATSNVKVDDPPAMRRQNELFRRLARAPFGELLESAVRDPALLIWLDAPANRKGHPNENLARELMELFTLGIGHYSETDVKETARALTGWTVVDGEFREAPSRHDDGAKTILGKSGKWRGSDVVRIILEHPATADRLAGRICELLMGEGAVAKPALIRAGRRPAVARPRRRLGRRDGAPLPRVLRRGQPGHARARPRRVRRRRGARPGAARPAPEHAGAGRLVGPAGTGPVLSAQRRRLARRAELALGPLADRPGQLRDGPGRRPGRRPRRPLDPIALAGRYGRGRDRVDTITFCAELLLGFGPDGRWMDRLEASLGAEQPGTRIPLVARLLISWPRRKRSSVSPYSLLTVGGPHADAT